MPSAMASEDGASTPPMTGTNDHHIGDERCIDVFVVISGILHLHRNIGRKHDSKWPLMNEIYLEFSEIDAAADAGMNTVPIKSPS